MVIDQERMESTWGSGRLRRKKGSNGSTLGSLAAPQPHGLAVLLELGDKLITLLHHVLVLLVFVVGAVCLDDTLASDAIDGAGYTAGCDKFGKVTTRLFLC
jgi:hypothetical protein